MAHHKLIPEDKIREDRITFDIVVDAYDESERAMGWYYYLQDNLQMPFEATCKTVLPTSALQLGQKVRVLELAREDICLSEMLVNVAHGKVSVTVPLRQLACESVDKDTQEAVADWHYWIARGYEYLF